MAKRSTKRRYTHRTLGDRIADLEAQIAELRARAKELGKFSPEAVKKDRARVELTAADYAELVGVSMITIYSWETGRSRPRAGQLELWLAAKGMPKEAAWRKLGIEAVPEFSGKAVKAERDRLGLSALTYGKLVGVSGLTVYNWEKGKSVPRGPALEKWLVVRGIGRAKAEKELGRT